jgi:hypothetical protein
LFGGYDRRLSLRGVRRDGDRAQRIISTVDVVDAKRIKSSWEKRGDQMSSGGEPFAH